MTNKPALILVDVQKGLLDPYWGNRNNLQAEDNIASLLSAFRQAERPIFHVQHLSQSPLSPLRPDQVGVEFMDFIKPRSNEPIFQKNVNSAFIGTKLEETLRNNKITSLIMAGVSTDHCVSTSVRMAANLGFDVTVVADATFTFDRKGLNGKIYSAAEVHDITLASLQDEFAKITNTHDIIVSMSLGT